MRLESWFEPFQGGVEGFRAHPMYLEKDQRFDAGKAREQLEAEREERRQEKASLERARWCVEASVSEGEIAIDLVVFSDLEEGDISHSSRVWTGTTEAALTWVRERAARLGLSRTEYLRRRLRQDAARPVGPVTVADLQRFSSRFVDLGDVEVMRGAWS
jgi:hypothetical protein